MRSLRQIRLQPMARKASWMSAAFVADAEAAVLMQPGDRPFDDPAAAAEPGSVRSLRPGDLRLDVPAAQLAPCVARVVGAVAVQLARAVGWSTATAAHRRDRVHECDQLGDVVAVAAGQRAGERRAAPQAIRWCLEPRLERSTGLGPVFSPPQTPARASCRSPHVTSRSTRPRSTWRAAAHAAAARHPPPATP